MRPTLLRLSARISLIHPSPFVRIRGAPQLTAAIEGDFTFFPTYFSQADSRTLLEAALWKLDRGDYTRRRRRRAQTIAEVGEGEGGMLQDVFSGEYGFEEVSRRVRARVASSRRGPGPSPSPC
jgi:hypothetical protein